MTNLTPYLLLDTVAWPLRKDDGVSSSEHCDSGYCCMAPAQEWQSRSELGFFLNDTEVWLAQG